MEHSFEYVIPVENRIKGRPSQKCSLQKLDYVWEMLDDVHRDMLMESCFGQLYRMKRIHFSAQLVHQLAMRMIATKKQREFWFSIGGKPTRFSLNEFSLITGLRASEEPSLEPHILTNERLVKKHFKKCKKGITVYNLKDAIKSARVCMKDKYKIGLVYILETILLPKENYTYINLEHLSMVDDLEAFNSYPWGKKAFGRTVDVFMRDWRALVKSYLVNDDKYPYSVYGFPLAIQIWAYEVIPSIGRRYAEKLEEADLPRICRWNSFEMPNSKDICASLDEPNIVVHCTLKPTHEEASKAYWMEIHQFSDEVDDPTVDIFVDNVNGADSSIRDDFPQQTCQSPYAYTSPRDPSSFHMPSTSTDAHPNPRPSTSYPSRDDFTQELRMQFVHMVETLERNNEMRINQMRSYIDQRFDCVTSLCRQIDEKVSSVVQWIKNSNLSTPYIYHTRSGFTNTGGAHDVENDENEDGNEQRQATDNLFVNESISVKENLLVDDNEPKQTSDVNEYQIPVEVENEERQATNMLNDDQAHVEEIDACIPMDSQSHGDVVESVPTVVEDESDGSSQNGRGKRIKKRSFILRSPFTNPEKRRKLDNITAFDPFRELDPAKADDLNSWLVNATDSDHVEMILFTKPKSFFVEIQKQFGWLSGDHIDIVLYLMRARIETHPSVFAQDCAILDCAFTNMCNKRFEDFELHKKERKPIQDFKWLKNMSRYIYGKSPDRSKRWDSCTSLYIPCNVEMKHWIALKVDIAERTIYVYDSMKSCTRFGKLQKVMRPIVKVIPRMMRESLLFGEDYPQKQFAWRRHTEVPQQNNAGDCGIYAIKFIELLSAGLDVKLISDDMIECWRKKLAAEVFAMHLDP